MLFILRVALVVALVTLFFYALPCGAVSSEFGCTADNLFAPLNGSMLTAMETAGSWVGWTTGLLGAHVRDAIMNCVILGMTIGGVFFIWTLVKRYLWPLLVGTVKK